MADAGKGAGTDPGSSAAGVGDGRERAESFDLVAQTYWETADEHPPLTEPKGMYRFFHFLARPVFSWYFQTEVHGAEHVPATGPVILAASHRSNLDTPLLGIVTRRPVNFMAKQEFFKHPLSLRFFRRMGAFPVNRAAPDKCALRRALDVLEADSVLGIYPEGTRGSGPQIGEVHRGPAWIAVHSGAPVVPVGVGGSCVVQPKGSSGIKPAKVRIVVGPPLYPPPSRAKRSVEAFSDEMVKAIQAAFDEAGGEGPLERVPRSEFVRGY